MTKREPRYSKEEFAIRGDAIYETQIQPLMTEVDFGRYVLIDIETGVYEVDTDEIAASDRLLQRLPDAQVWMVQVGSKAARKIRSGLRSQLAWSFSTAEAQRAAEVSQSYDFSLRFLSVLCALR